MFKFIKKKIFFKSIIKKKFKIKSMLLKKKKKLYIHKNKISKLSILKKILHNNKYTVVKNIQKYYGRNWIKKLIIINLVLARTKPIKRFKLFYINFAIYIYFFENTIPIKNIFFRAIKYRPIRRHKRYTKNILIVLQHCINILQSQNITTKLQVIFKGKLGLRGDNKKKKHVYVLSTGVKYKINKIHFYDGVGSSSGYGHTFMRLRYGPTVF